MSAPRFRFYRDEHGVDRVERVDAVVCDFCLGPDPRWEFPAAEMDVPNNPVMGASDDEWLACDECRALIDAHKLGELVERACREQPKNVPPGTRSNQGVAFYPPLPIRRRRTRETMLRFMDARTGPARPFG